MKRLGMWNRLALVIGVTFSLGGATWDSYNQNIRASRLAEVGRDACLKNENYVPIDGKSQFSYCWDFWDEVTKPARPTLDDWGINATGLAVLAMIIYALLWIVIATAKWIWRGRKVS